MTHIEPEDVFALPAHLAEQAERQRLIDESLKIAASAAFTRNDFKNMGLTRTQTDALLEDVELSPDIIRTGARPHTSESDRVVTIVPANQKEGLARTTIMEESWYARYVGKRTAVPQIASYLSITEGDEIRRIWPIRRRYYVPSIVTAIPVLCADVAPVLHSPLYRDHFPDPADVMIVGNPVVLDKPVKLGYPNVQGVRSYTVGTLTSVDQLLGAPTVS